MHEAEWKPFKAFGKDGTLEIKTTGSGIDGIRISGSGPVPYVTRSGGANGIARFIGEESLRFGSDAGEAVTVGLDTQTAFWQPCRFVTGQNVHIVRGRHLDRYAALFLLPLLVLQMKSKFNWGGNGATLARMKRLRLMLPMAGDGSPDWDFMDACVKSMEERLLARWKRHAEERLAGLEEREIPRLEEKAWKAFVIGDLFTVVAGEGLEKWNMVPGGRPFVGASCFSNGVTDFVGNVNGSLDRLVLGVNADGSVGEAFVHPYECLFSNHVSRLHLKNRRDSEAVLLFCAQAVRKQKEKYSFGYAFKATRMRRQEIMLPADGAGEPDWAYMEQYVKNMMAKKLRQFQSFLEAGAVAERKPEDPAGGGGTRAA